MAGLGWRDLPLPRGTEESQHHREFLTLGWSQLEAQATLQWGEYWPWQIRIALIWGLCWRKLFLVSLCLLEPQTFSLCNLSQDNFWLPLRRHLLVPGCCLKAQNEKHALSYSAAVFPERSLGLHHFLLRQAVAPAMAVLGEVWLRSRWETEGESCNSKEYSNSYELIMIIMRRSEKEGKEEDLSSC